MFIPKTDSVDEAKLALLFSELDAGNYNEPAVRELHEFLSAQKWGSPLITGEALPTDKAKTFIKYMDEDDNDSEDDEYSEEDSDEDKEDSDDYDEEQEDAKERRDKKGNQKGKNLADWASNSYSWDVVAKDFESRMTMLPGAYGNVMLEKDPVGSEFKWRTAEVSDLPRISKVWFKRPLFLLSLLKGDIMVTENYSIIQKEKIVVLCVDFSGSMSEYWKEKMVKSLLLAYMNLTVKDGTTVLLSKFISTLFDQWVLRTEEDVKRVLTTPWQASGGFTDVQGCLQQAQQQLLQGRWGNSPIDPMADIEIVVINDGEDRVSPNFRPSFKLHAFQIGVNNTQLTDAVKRSGGMNNIKVSPHFL